MIQLSIVRQPKVIGGCGSQHIRLLVLHKVRAYINQIHDLGLCHW